MPKNYGYVVSAKRGTKRIRTSKVWRTKKQADSFAKQTNKNFRGQGARAVKATKKEYQRRNK